MRILIIGGAGMIGRKLAQRIVADGHVGSRLVTTVQVADIERPATESNGAIQLEPQAINIAIAGNAAQIVATRPEIIFHLAAMVSSEAEENLVRGYHVNLDGTRNLIEAIRRESLSGGYRPRLVFASSLAVFGSPLPNRIPDDFHPTPMTSYGTQKAMGELMIADYDRRGFLEGVSVRLPTICVRPGAPNRAASGFFSAIIREPLIGQRAILPVPETVRHCFASPRSAVDFLLRAATLSRAQIGPHANLNMPVVSATVGEQIDVLRKIAGTKAATLIDRVPNPAIERIVTNWPRDFEATRARHLGFSVEQSFEDLVRSHIEEEFP